MPAKTGKRICRNLIFWDFPVTEKAAEEVFAIPIYPELTPDQKKYVVDTIESFYK